MDEVETLAIERAKALFGAEHANVQPHSGASANAAVYHALLEHGDTVLGLRLDHGGHLTHGHKVNFSGRNYHFVSYGVREDSETIDYDEVARLAREHRPKLIVTGASAYARTIDFARFRAIADEVGALSWPTWRTSRASSRRATPSPVPHAHVVSSTTHKSLAGPRAGFILSTAELAKKIDSAVFPGLQGGPLCHVTAGKAVCFAVAGTEAFRNYQRQVRLNAAALAEGLVAGGHRLVSSGTGNHLVLLNLRARTGRARRRRIASTTWG